MSTSNVDSNVPSDSVVKLIIGEHENEDKFVSDSVRRISIGRLLNTRNELSYLDYLELAKYCVLYSPYAPSFEDKGSKKVKLDDWKIITTYIDSDGDRITFSSCVEFAEAINQIPSGENVLRVRADVTKKGGIAKSTSEEQDNVLPKVVLSEEDRKINSNEWGNKNKIKRSVRGNNGGWGAATSEPSVTAPGGDSANFETNETKRARSDSKLPERNNYIPTGMRAIPSNKENRESCELKESVVSHEEKDSDEFDSNFVHARHTCDGCSVSPIVGIRYHAQNIPDYDLCQVCMTKSTCSDIVFKPEQLQRDMRFQYKRLREERMAKVSGGRRRQGYHGERRNTRRFAKAKAVESKHHEDLRLSSVPRRTEDKPRQEAPSAAKRGENNNSNKNVDDVTEVLGLVLGQFSNAVSVIANEFAVAVKEGETNKIEKSLEKESENNVVKLTKTLEDCTVSSANDDVLTVGQTKDDDVSVVQTKDDGVSVVQTKDDDASVVQTKDDDVSVGVVTDEISEPGKKEEDTKQQNISKNEPLNIAQEEELFNMTTPSSKGNNSTGHEVLTEQRKKEELPKVDVDGALAIVPAPKLAAAPVSGEMENTPSDGSWSLDEETPDDCVIIDSNSGKDGSTPQTSDDDSSHGSDEWSVVGDEKIVANATRVIGSALFQEDMTRSQEDLTSHQGTVEPQPSFASLGSSIPTISSDNASQLSVLVSRWKNELHKLREFGFEDDRKSIDALEALAAEKIGNDDVDVVTIDEAVNYLLNHAQG